MSFPLTFTYIVDCILRREMSCFYSFENIGTLNNLPFFYLGHQYDLSNEDYLPSLVLSLFHKAQYDFSETPLGKVEIDLSTISCDKTDTWYALVPDQGKTMDVSGEVNTDEY